MLGHSFESYQILHHVKGFEDLARWGLTIMRLLQAMVIRFT
jgi:hypothetical protein